jgi:hypothetical protein
MMMLFGDSHAEFFKFLPTAQMEALAGQKPDPDFLWW